MKTDVSFSGYKKYALALLIGFIVVYLWTLGVRPMTRLDEFRYAEIAREMLATGDWISPHLNGVRYFEKPVLGHWIGAAAQWLFGDSLLATRLPSALSTGITALFVFLFMRRFTGDPKTALTASFIYLTCLAVFGVGTTNILDPLLSLWLTMAVGFFYSACVESDPARQIRFLVVTGLCCGLAFLTKGFLAFAVPVVVALPFVAWQRCWARLPQLVAVPAITAILVALPWSIAVHLHEPDFWHYFFWVEHIHRFTAESAQHSQPPWYFLVRFPLMVFPWVVLLPLAIAGVRKKLFDPKLVGYLLLWFVMPFLFFSASSGKLVTYILPCFPPFAVLTALGLKSALEGASVDFARRGCVVLMCLYLVGALFLSLNGAGLAGRPIFDASEPSRWITAMAGLVACALIVLIGMGNKWSEQRHILPGLSILPLLVIIPFVIPNSTRESKMPTEFFDEQKQIIDPGAILISDGSYFRSVAWAFKRDDIYMASEGELAYGLTYSDARHRLLDAESAASLIAENAGRVDLAFFINENSDGWLTPLMPAGANRIQRGKYIHWYLPARTPVDISSDQPDSQLE